jgi:hypothetical protein
MKSEVVVDVVCVRDALLNLSLLRDEIYAQMQKQKSQNPERFAKKKSSKKPASSGSKTSPPPPPAPAPEPDTVEQAQSWHDDL